MGPQKQGRIELVLPQENPNNQGLGYKYTTTITKDRQQTLDILNRPTQDLKSISQSNSSIMVCYPSSHRSELTETYPIDESSGEDLKLLLQEKSVALSSNIEPIASS